MMDAGISRPVHASGPDLRDVALGLSVGAGRENAVPPRRRQRGDILEIGIDRPKQDPEILAARRISAVARVLLKMKTVSRIAVSAVRRS
jgi:hypothetical protein